MVEPSEWSRGERELLAAFVSSLNRCDYCVGIHAGTATIALGQPISTPILERWRPKDFTPRAGAAFALLETLAADPDANADNAVAVARAAGLSDDAIADGLAIAFIFNLVNRLADAFGYSFGDEDGRLAQARALHRLAYKVPAFLLA